MGVREVAVTLNRPADEDRAPWSGTSERTTGVDDADLAELIRWIAMYGSADKLLREHALDVSGHCPRCHSLGCTLWTAARAAKHVVATS